MENAEHAKFKKLFNAGLILIPFLILVLIYSGISRSRTFDFFENDGMFFINYIASLSYFIVVLVTNRPFFKFGRIDRRLFILVLVHFSISAFTLNNNIPIFALLSPWAIIYLVLFYVSFIGLCFIEDLPLAARALVFFFLGAGFVLLLYFTIYLAPLYHIALIGIIFFGLSIHLLIPLIIVVSLIIIFIKLEKSRLEKFLFYSGIIIPLIITVLFLFKWNTFRSEIHKASSATITRPYNTLPTWVLLCQDMPTDHFSQRMIEGRIRYETFDDLWRRGFRNTFDELKRHDPLINTGIAILGDINISRDDRIRILKSQYNARHLTQRKLWSGRKLETIEVLNNIKVFPDYRLAYTEKIISIRNNSSWESEQEEAAYTFYLPEGSVATSLSLWIDGKEEKSRLTTKSKADSAYVSIVGVERRDPALLHWQEGNTLTVTVFPCTPMENRKFKIGITTPLEKTGDKLKLTNIYFEGPAAKDIMETTVIQFESDERIENISLPGSFKKQQEYKYQYSGKYRPYREIICDATSLSHKSFSFNNKSYHLSELSENQTRFNPLEIYLDINKSWSKYEFDAVMAYASGLKVFAFDDRVVAVNNENKDELFFKLSNKNFSLFAFNEIKDIDNSLVISKSTELSPNLADLKETEFIRRLVEGINSTTKKINLFQLGTTISPYLRTLKELQVLNFSYGSVSELKTIIGEKKFRQSNEEANQVDIDIASVTIHRDTLTAKSEAPDHLLRLFAYNKLMKDLGRNYFNNDKSYIEKLIVVANEAYIVSPLSSLVVLESIKDYDRFDIGENKNSLKNASMESTGAVPEPSEWVLISILLSIILITSLRRYHIL